jgi:hypothetical protein
MSARQSMDAVIDRIRFQLDTWPRMAYQPLPWLGKPTASRADGVHTRWQALKREVERLDVESAVDIGAQSGFFAFALAEMGLSVTAIERDPTFYRTILFAQRRIGAKRFAVSIFDLQESSLDLLPKADVSVFMSVWHHHVRSLGIESALRVLRGVWDRCGVVMFFETGQDEMPKEFGLPEFLPDPRTWIARVLGENCPGGQVKALGSNAAFDPAGNPCQRELFMVFRNA